MAAYCEAILSGITCHVGNIGHHVVIMRLHVGKKEVDVGKNSPDVGNMKNSSENTSYPESHPTEMAASPTGSTIQDFPITLNMKKTFEYPRTLALIGFFCGKGTV